MLSFLCRKAKLKEIKKANLASRKQIKHVMQSSDALTELLKW
jgi:hypothetical protein